MCCYKHPLNTDLVLCLHPYCKFSGIHHYTNQHKELMAQLRLRINKIVNDTRTVNDVHSTT